MRRLSTAAFRNDYMPLVAGDSWLGQSVVSLAAALRQLDDSEVRALVRFFPEGTPREASLASLLALQKRPDQPVQAVIPPALDRLWETALRPWFQSEFAELIDPGSVRKHPSDSEVEIEQVSATQKLKTR